MIKCLLKRVSNRLEVMYWEKSWVAALMAPFIRLLEELVSFYSFICFLIDSLNLFQDNSRQLVAIKCINKKSLSKQSIDNIINEISITKRIKNKFIVELKDFDWNEDYIYLIFEFCSGGELAQLIRKNNRFPEPVVRHFLQQMATALKVLRTNSVAHMDLKPQNILIESKVAINCWTNIVLKIADFGFAQYLRNEDFGTTLRGSPLYMAPEILVGGKYDASVDLWSVGVILYECLFGSPPFTSVTIEELVKKITSCEPIVIPKTAHISDKCRDLLERLLQRDPQKRICFEEFFDHPFIDLEHMPSPESYQKGVQLIREAVDNDLNGEYNKCLRLYTEGLQYLVPIYNWGDGSSQWQQSKQIALKNKLIEYMERAEEIKNKCDLIVVDTKDLKSIKTAFESIERADHLIKNRVFKQAFNEYNKAIGIGFEILPKLKNKERALLYQQLNQWITKAEHLKTEFNCNKNSQKRSFKSNESSKSGQKNVSLSFDKFVSKFSDTKDLRSSQTCYIQ